MILSYLKRRIFFSSIFSKVLLCFFSKHSIQDDVTKKDFPSSFYALFGFIFLFSFLSLGCSDSECDCELESQVSFQNLIEKPSNQSGPFKVGFKTWSITYQPPEWDEERTLTLNLWYPVEKEVFNRLSQEEDAEFGRYLERLPDSEILVDAPPASSLNLLEGYPVLLHSHGWKGYGGNSAFLMRHFASHGWVVIAPDHTGNLLFDHWDPFPSYFDLLRSSDLKESLDALSSLAQDPLWGAFDLQRVILSGHSYGGYSAWASGGIVYNAERQAQECPQCTPAQLVLFDQGLRDPRIVGIISMAGPISEPQRSAENQVTFPLPALVMSGSEDQADLYREQFTFTQNLDLLWLEIQGACHTSFALASCETLDFEEGYQLIQSYALSFARFIAFKDRSESTLKVLQGHSFSDDQVRIQSTPQSSFEILWTPSQK